MEGGTGGGPSYMSSRLMLHLTDSGQQGPGQGELPATPRRGLSRGGGGLREQGFGTPAAGCMHRK